MKTVKVYANGISLSTQPDNRDNVKPPIRTSCAGWSKHAAKRNRDFLYSVDNHALAKNYYGVAFTLTVKDIPETPEIWAQVRNILFRRIHHRCPDALIHWVTEVTARARPHMHGALYVPWEFIIEQSKRHSNDLTHIPIGHWIRYELHWAWCEVATSLGTNPYAQDIKVIEGTKGWSQYLAKHNARTCGHYQRKNFPKQWEEYGSGRVWGKRGDWPTKDSVSFDLEPHQYWPLRRAMKRWRIAKARVEKNEKTRRKSIQAARKAFKHHDRRVTEVRGVSEWMDADNSPTLINWAMTIQPPSE